MNTFGAKNGDGSLICGEVSKVNDDFDEIFGALAEIGYKGRIVSEPFVVKGGEVGRDIFVWSNLESSVSEEDLDAEAKYLLEFERAMLKKYHM